VARKKNEIKDNYIQLDLIPPTEVEKLYKEFTDVKESSDKVRRGVFAKTTGLAKKVQELECQIESLQQQLFTLNSLLIIQLGLVTNVQSNTVESQETTSLHTTSVNVMFAEKLHPSHVQEVMDILILSA
jgi:hypothetical protein